MTSENNIPVYAQRLRIARELRNVSVAELAQSIDKSQAFYRDLEATTDLTQTCSLHDLIVLCGQLHITPLSLFSEMTTKPRQLIGVDDIILKMKAYCREKNISVPELGNTIGWKIDQTIDSPASVLAQWNIDCLKDVCQMIGVNWLSVVASL